MSVVHPNFGIRVRYRAVKSAPEFIAECECGFRSDRHGTRKAAIAMLEDHLGVNLGAKLAKEVRGLAVTRSTVGMAEMFPEA